MPRIYKRLRRQEISECVNCHTFFEWSWLPSRPVRRFCSRKCQTLFCKPSEVLRTHGEGQNQNGGTPTWITWHNMVQRCNDPGAANWKYYGARCIKVCDRWQGSEGFVNFKADMGERPEGKTLDRRDTDGNYEPSNCRWATAKEQSANRRNSQATTTHCRNGHERTPANTYTYPNGHTCCKVCKKAGTDRSNERISMKNRLHNAVREFHQDQQAQSLVEYGLLCVIVALGVVAGMGQLAASLNAEFSKIAGKLS